MAETLERMAELDIPEVGDQAAFNLARWREVVDDPELARVEGRVETNRYGEIIMTPPPGFGHSTRQGSLLHFINQAIPGGRALPECPLSTSEGVKGVDVIWISEERLKESLVDELLTIAPEICVEVLSPSNKRGEIEEKRRLYFEAGAEEVWVCDLKGRLAVFLKAAPEVIGKSLICPEIPDRVE